MTLFNGYALYKKVTAWNSGSSIGRSLNHYLGCQHLQGYLINIFCVFSLVGTHFIGNSFIPGFIGRLCILY